MIEEAPTAPKAPPYGKTRRLLSLLAPGATTSQKSVEEAAQEEARDDGDFKSTFRQSVAEDAVMVLKDAGVLQVVEYSRAASLIEEERFEKFMDLDRSTRSDYLLVNSNHIPCSDQISPVSAVVAKMFTIIRDLQAFDFGPKGAPYVLAYFCDTYSHKPFRDDVPEESCKPIGIILSLIGQLAEQMMQRKVAVDLSFLDDRDWEAVQGREKAGTEKLKARQKRERMATLLGVLGEVFDNLIGQLPEGSTVCCFVDGVETYEGDGNDQVLVPIVEKLVELVKKCKGKKGGICFKLLVTAERSSLKLGPVFGNAQLYLEENPPLQDSARYLIENLGLKIGTVNDI
jgi:hypothetical protein